VNPSLKGIVLGVISLAVLDAVVSHASTAAAAGGVWKFLSDGLNRFISPTVGFFSASDNASSSSSSTSTSTAKSSASSGATTPAAAGLAPGQNLVPFLLP
jgi:hypothetical protein